jgi:hypothetical protein
MRTVLHVGCGRKDIRGLPAFFQDGSWSEIRLDIDRDVRPDVIGTMTDMGAVPTGSVHALFSSHNVEHLYPHEVPAALAEFRRVLSPDGFALVTCPDLQAVAALIGQDRLLEPAYHSGMGPIAPLDILYGHRASIARGNRFMAHRGGFTMRTLGQALADAGFGRVMAKRRPVAFDLWALALVPDDQTALEVIAKLLMPT